VDGDRQLGDLKGLSRAAGKDCDVRGQNQLARNHALRIVVTLHHEDADTRSVQSHHLLAEEKASVEILPVAVVDIAGEEDEGDFLLEGFVDQPLEGTAGCGAEARDRRAFIAVKAAQRAVDVEVGGVEESDQVIVSIIRSTRPPSKTNRILPRRSHCRRRRERFKSTHQLSRRDGLDGLAEVNHVHGLNEWPW